MPNLPIQIVIIGGAVGGMIVLFVFVAWLTGRRGHGKTMDRLGVIARVEEQAAAAKVPKRTPRKSDVDPFVVRFFRGMSHAWRLGDASHGRLQELLVHAGVREKGAVEIFLGAKLAITVALPAGAIAVLLWRARSTGALSVSTRQMVMYGALALVIGLMLPNMWLRRKAQARIHRIRLSLPDALDLMIVCVESGLGLDAALVRISRELADVAPDLCEELALMNLEVSAGKPRGECLRHLALRTGCEEVEALCARINQSAKYGTNLGDSLRIHSDTLRRKRRQEAEERAAKTTVKLLFPLVFFIFPAMFVVILGPAVPKIVEELF